MTITNPDKVFFPEAGHTKLDLAKYYVAVAERALRGVAGRPIVLKRYVNGAGERVLLPEARARTHARLARDVTISFPSGRTARRSSCATRRSSSGS